MRCVIAVVAVTTTGWCAGERLLAQESKVIPAVAVKPAAEPSGRAIDLAKLSAPQRHFYLSGKSGMEWLQRVNRADGRFVPGLNPALRVPLETDGYLHQASAALALAQCAAFYQDDRAAIVAKQAILTLLLETAVDPKTQARATAAPESFVNRLAAAGLLALAIHELPNPATDLLQEAERLTHYLRLQQQADGGFIVAGESDAEKAAVIEHCTGPALHAIMRGQARQPAAWRLEATRKACAHYLPWWRAHKNPNMISDHAAAYAEAFLATKEPTFAQAVFEMNDWLCGLQYTNADPRRPQWTGGIQPWVEGKARPTCPTIDSAAAAASLVAACRAARGAGDLQRLQRYRAALENCLVFLTTLQYTEENTRHFADNYRYGFLIGGFHRSHQDGSVDISGQHLALAALVAHLRHTAELP